MHRIVHLDLKEIRIRCTGLGTQLALYVLRLRRGSSKTEDEVP